MFIIAWRCLFVYPRLLSDRHIDRNILNRVENLHRAGKEHLIVGVGLLDFLRTHGGGVGPLRFEVIFLRREIDFAGRFARGEDASAVGEQIMSICENYPKPALDCAMNFLSTHDTERGITAIAGEPANGRDRYWQSKRMLPGDRIDDALRRGLLAYAMLDTLPGVPCVYYGDEIGMQGYRDPFNRAFFCWDSHEKRLKPVLAQLAQLRHSCEAFRTGELRVLRAQDGILHYQRVGEAETAEIIVNRSEHIIVEPLASGKHTEVNPMGFTIVVEENGHNPNHSYYDIK